MKCCNCPMELPDGANYCPRCGQTQDQEPPDPKVIEEILKVVDAEDPGLVNQLKAMAKNFATAEDFANSIFASDCPTCGSENTETCDDVKGIQNPIVCRCIKCCTLFCTDCRQVFENDVVTISSPECPVCGSSDTDYPIDESEDEFGGFEMQDVVTCHNCGAGYCFECGKPLGTDDNEETG